MKAHISTTIKKPELSMSQLQNETGFIRYIRILKGFSKRYTVIIASADTPVWDSYTEDISNEVMNLGLETDLCGKYRLAYAAIIDE